MATKKPAGIHAGKHRANLRIDEKAASWQN
jgi:hypothetical protein